MFEFMDDATKNVLKDSTANFRYGNLTQTVASVARVSQSGKSALRNLTGPGGAGTGSRDVLVALEYVFSRTLAFT